MASYRRRSRRATAGGPPAERAASRRARRADRGGRAPSSPTSRLSAPVFGRIDHIGVAVDDLDAAVALYRDQLGMREQHRETVEEFGVEAVLLEIGDGHVELLSAARARTRRGQVPRAQRARACTTWPTRPTTSTRRSRPCARAGLRADRRAAAHRHPRAAAWRSCTRSRPAACSPSSWSPRTDGRRRPDASTSASRAGRCWPCASTPDVLRALRKAARRRARERWFELKTQDSDVAIDLSQVVYVRLDTEEHRVGF